MWIGLVGAKNTYKDGERRVMCSGAAGAGSGVPVQAEALQQCTLANQIADLQDGQIFLSRYLTQPCASCQAAFLECEVILKIS